MLAFAAVLALSAGQEDPAVDRQIERLREQLRLTDDQLPKVRELVKKQMDDLKAVLTDEQKTRLESAARGGGGPPPWARGGRRGGLPDTDDLKTQLALTEAQVSKVNELRDQAREEMRRFFQNRSSREGGEDIGQALERMRNETYAKIREVLTDEQKPKYDEILKQAQAQAQATPSTEGDRGRGRSLDDRIARVMEVLKFEKPEEAEAVKGLVRKVYEAMEKMESAQRDSRSKIEELTRATDLSDEAIGDKLAEIRKTLKEPEKDLAAARAALADVVTHKQEAELLRRGVLR